MLVVTVFYNYAFRVVGILKLLEEIPRLDIDDSVGLDEITTKNAKGAG